MVSPNYTAGREKKTRRLTLTLGRLFLGQHASLDSLLHPDRSAVRSVLGDTTLAVMKLLLARGLEGLLLVFVNDAVIVRVCIPLSNKGLSFDVVTTTKA